MMFVIPPDPYLTPSFRISPFRTSDIAFNNNLDESTLITDYLDERFGKRKYALTKNGRQSIHIALSNYNLQRDDVVTILTTTGNQYISSCVTNEIEEFCKWSRKIETSTKVLFVNHEFGFPYPGLNTLKEHGLPVIEDCAHSFFSKDNDNSVGKTGDYVIFSFPKMFPIQIGGLIVANRDNPLRSPSLPVVEDQYIRKVVSHHLQRKEDIIHSRLRNYRMLTNLFESLDVYPRFKLKPGLVPGVFMFTTSSHQIDLQELKKYCYSNGIQSSVFYGEEAFYIPVHQVLKADELMYFFEVIKDFLTHYSK